MPEHTVVPARVRLLAALMAMTLVAVSYAIWTSPQARRVAGKIITAPVPGHGLTDLTDQPDRGVGSTDKAAGQDRSAGAAQGTRRTRGDAVRDRLSRRQDPAGDYASAATGRSNYRRPVVAAAPAPHAGRWSTARPRAKKCWDFRWQQDAQAAYLANLTDPTGLDGPPGPYNDDGIACAELPVDPQRARSRPTGAKPVARPRAPSVAALRIPQKRYFGIYTEQSPFAWGEVDRLVAAVGKMPSMAGYFSAGDERFRADAAVAAWTRGMLPIVTWEMRPREDMGPGGVEQLREKYSLAEIAQGSLDPYLKAYARDVAVMGLPIAIRLNHEMNGGWYPWSVYDTINAAEDADGVVRSGAYWYQRMWRHVHDVFRKAGARNVLWVWSPNLTTFARADFRNFYPGDEYVDWIGLSGYYRPNTKAPTFDATYGPTLRQLRDRTRFPRGDKPILLSEIGATEAGGNKVTWINDLFAAFKLPENADLIGFAWFHHVVTSAPPSDPTALTSNDWRITSTSAAAAAFTAGIVDPSFSSGH